MNNITNVQGAHSVAPSFGSTKTEQQTVATPPQQKENGDKKLMLALAGIAATSAALVYGVKSGKLQKALDKLKNKAKDITEAAQNTAQASGKAQQKTQQAVQVAQNSAQQAANKASETVQDTASQASKKIPHTWEEDFTGPLPKFDKNTTKPGTYICDDGKKVIIDKMGTGTVLENDGSYFINSKGNQEYYYKGKNRLYGSSDIEYTAKKNTTDVTDITAQVFEKPQQKTIQETTTNNNPNILKTFKDSNGDTITIDNYGTAILDRGNGSFQVTHGNEQKFYDSANIVSDAPKTGPASSNAKIADNTASQKTFKDSNGDTITIDNYGTGILERDDKTFQVTHGSKQKIYDALNFDGILQKVNDKVEIYKKTKDRKIYKEIVKLTHPDNYANSNFSDKQKETLENILKTLAA